MCVGHIALLCTCSKLHCLALTTFATDVICRITERSYVPGNTPILGQIGIIASLISLILQLFFWYASSLSLVHACQSALFLPALAVHSPVRLTGIEASHNRRIVKFFGEGKAPLQQAVGTLLPPSLLQKIQRRKLVEAADEDEQLLGRVYKML
jgi:hypothetical protein